ncbi:MAG: HupE/UreJ family protein [Motiliproteus sp.]
MSSLNTVNTQFFNDCSLTLPACASCLFLRGKRFKVIQSLLLLVSLFISASASAHTLGQTYLYMTVSETALTGRFEVTASDLNAALGLQLTTDGSLDLEQIDPYQEQIANYLQDNVSIALNGKPAVLHYQSTTLRSPKIAQYVMTEFRIESPAGIPDVIDVEYGVMFDVDPKQQAYLLIENNWRSGTFENEAKIALTFAADDRKQRLDLSESTLLRGIWSMATLGMHHIIEGIDHVMFLVALLLTAVVLRAEGRWQGVENFRVAAWNLLKIITLFTLAHSITLSLTTFETLAIPARVVESVIAASIAVAALEVFYPIFRSRIGPVVFLFGLFHGAGFASVLLSMNIHSDYLALTLLGFNLGVELGQIAIVLLCFPLLFMVRSQWIYLRFGIQSIASGLILVASYWFIERAFDVDLPAGEYAQRVLAIFI